MPKALVLRPEARTLCRLILAALLSYEPHDFQFDFLFDICLPSNHCINAGRVPDGFVPLESPKPVDLIDNTLPSIYVMSGSIDCKLCLRYTFCQPTCRVPRLKEPFSLYRMAGLSEISDPYRKFKTWGDFPFRSPREGNGQARESRVSNKIHAFGTDTQNPFEQGHLSSIINEEQVVYLYFKSALADSAFRCRMPMLRSPMMTIGYENGKSSIFHTIQILTDILGGCISYPKPSFSAMCYVYSLKSRGHA